MTAPSASALARSSSSLSAPFSLKDFLRSFMLFELFKGLAITGKYAFSRKITVQFPEEKTPLSPRFRYDQIMRLGWKIFIPVTLVWLVVVGAWMQTPFNIWK